jgi:hypothetical protein
MLDDKLPTSHFYGQFRWGRVSAAGAARHTVQVEFFELDGFVSFDLQVLVTRPGDYSVPPEGTMVLCVLIEGKHGEGRGLSGFVLGAFYTEEDEAPLDDEAKRSIAGDDIRLGDPEASDKVALARLVNSNFEKLKQHFNALEQVISGPSIPEPGNGAPSALQAALAIAITAPPYPDMDDVDAENVSAT